LLLSSDVRLKGGERPCEKKNMVQRGTSLRRGRMNSFDDLRGSETNQPVNENERRGKRFKTKKEGKGERLCLTAAENRRFCVKQEEKGARVLAWGAT